MTRRPNDGDDLSFEILGTPFSQRQTVRILAVTSGYFSTLRIPLLQGRLWDASENERGAALVVVNQSFVRRYFPKGNAIGEQIRLPELKIQPADAEYVVGVPDTDGWMQIIGVVADTLNDGLDRPVRPAFYMPSTRYMWNGTGFMIRTQGPPLASLESVRRAIQSVNSDQQAIRKVLDLNQWIERQPEYQQQRLFSILFGLFSGLALALALVGLYSVVSYSVAQRTNEFGVRMALGAQRTHIFWIVSRNVGITVSCGLAAGLIVFAELRKLLLHWTQNTDASPLILAAVAVLFLVCAALGMRHACAPRRLHRPHAGRTL